MLGVGHWGSEAEYDMVPNKVTVYFYHSHYQQPPFSVSCFYDVGPESAQQYEVHIIIIPILQTGGLRLRGTWKFIQIIQLVSGQGGRIQTQVPLIPSWRPSPLHHTVPSLLGHDGHCVPEVCTPML